MARQVNSGDPSSGFPSKVIFNQNGSISDADLTITGVKDPSKSIIFDASAQTTGKSITIAAGANSANIVLTLPTTSGTISVGAAGANTALSNLTTTALNQSLIFGSGTAGAIQTLATSDADSQSLNLISGSAASGGTTSGSVSLSTGNVTIGSRNPGSVTISTGNNTNNGQTGSVTISSGNATVNGGNPSGAVTVTTGTNPMGAGSTGVLTLSTGSIAAGVATPGSVSITPGTNSNTGSIGSVTFPNVGGQTSSIQFSATNSFTVPSGDSVAYLLTTGGGSAGFTTTGNGSMFIETGAVASAGNSPTGSVTIASGPMTNSAAGNSGNINLTTGLSPTSGNTGNIVLSCGVPNSGTQGVIQFKDGSQGTSSYVWTSKDTNGSGNWVAPASSYAARAYSSTTTISGSLATVVYATEDYDVSNSYNNSTGIYTAATAGKYQVNAALLFSGTVSLNNTVIIEIQKNSSVVSRRTVYLPAALTDGTIDISDIINCAATDTIRIQVSTSSTSPAIVSSNFDNYLSISKLP